MGAKYHCTQCGTCVELCPVYNVVREEHATPKGKQRLMQAVNEENLFQWEQTRDLVRSCAGCGRCKANCPMHLSVPEELADLRSRHKELGRIAWKIWIECSGLLWPIASLSSRMIPKGLTPESMEPLIAAARSLRGKRRRDVRPWFAIAPKTLPKGTQSNVVVFEGCTARTVRPEWTRKAFALLRGAGYTILEEPGFVCCGSTLYHAGLLDEAQAKQKTNFSCWEKLDRPLVVTLCASCHNGLEEYAQTLQPSQADAWRDSLRPLSSLLLDAETTAGQCPDRVVYHQPCHRKNPDTDMRLLLKALPTLRKGEELCCGMGGILKLTNPELSDAIAEQCWEKLLPEEMAGAFVVSGCSGCVLQLSATARGRAEVFHWLDVVGIEK